MSSMQQNRPLTVDEQFKMLFDRTAKLNDAVSALLAPAWGSESGIIPTDHPLYVAEQTAEQSAPVDWQAIGKRRERELKTVGEARRRAEQAIARVQALHKEEYGCCAECTSVHAVPYPCPTIRALEGTSGKAAP
ncbi:hypothetical protein [Streptomyces sp. NPDC005799]|uniref:hypothetical protein n=1 Tax=Streptomyces sp. NPDC005799 TaxID=3154678 RepID=UPI0033F41DBC